MRACPEQIAQRAFGAHSGRDGGHPMTIRGGGAPRGSMALTPLWRMDPPLRNSAADAHGCIMVWILWIRRIQACGAIVRALWRVPLGLLCTEPQPGCCKRG